MPTRERVSVIVPVYNSEKYLKECVESILEQKNCEIEAILVDDGSTDKSIQVMEYYQRQDRRVHVIKQKNAGVSSARNCGLAYSSGKYVMFVDADDRIFHDSCYRLLKAAEMHCVDIVIGNYAYQYGTKILKRIPRLEEGLYRYEKIKGTFVDDGTMTGILFGSVCGNLYKREYLCKERILFEPEVKINEDGLFNIDCICRGASIWNMDGEPLYIYRQWKKENKDLFIGKKEAFDVCDEKLMKRNDNLCSEVVFRQQMLLRKLTECFQLSLWLCQIQTYTTVKKEMKLLWEKQNYAELDNLLSENISHYKKIIYVLMKNRQYLVFYSVIRYIYPIVRKFVVR